MCTDGGHHTEVPEHWKCLSVLVHAVLLQDFACATCCVSAIGISTTSCMTTASLMAPGLCCVPWNPPVFYDLTWRCTADQSWKVANAPRWDALWKDLMNLTQERALNICIHASYLSLSPVCTELIWLVD